MSSGNFNNDNLYLYDQVNKLKYAVNKVGRNNIFTFAVAGVAIYIVAKKVDNMNRRLKDLEEREEDVTTQED